VLIVVCVCMCSVFWSFWLSSVLAKGLAKKTPLRPIRGRDYFHKAQAEELLVLLPFCIFYCFIFCLCCRGPT